MNADDAIDLVRGLIGLPDPEAGGEDLLSDRQILHWLNDGFSKLAKAVYGFPAYLEFTVTNAGVYTVTKSTSTPAVTTGLLTTLIEDRTWHNFPNVRSWTNFLNLTNVPAPTEGRLLEKMDLEDPRFQEAYVTPLDYFFGFSLDAERGFLLLPDAINLTNTVGIRYKQKNIRMHSARVFPEGGDITFTGVGLNDLTLAGTFLGGATYHCRIIIDSVTPDKFKVSYDGGATWSAAILCGTSAALSYGMTCTLATTGHTATNYWSFDLIPTDNIPALLDVDDCEYPQMWAALHVGIGLDDTRRQEFMTLGEIAKQAFIRDHFTRDLSPARSMRP